MKELTKQQKYYRKNKEKCLAISKRWADNNKEKQREQALAYYYRQKAADPTYLPKRRISEGKRRIARLERKAGRPKPIRCEVCNSKGKIVFEHCHKTGKFRGWTCYSCNTVLGNVQDSVDRLQKLIKYLQNANA